MGAPQSINTPDTPKVLSVKNVNRELRLFLPLLTLKFEYSLDALKCGPWVGKPLGERHLTTSSAQRESHDLLKLRFFLPTMVGAFWLRLCALFKTILVFLVVQWALVAPHVGLIYRQIQREVYICDESTFTACCYASVSTEISFLKRKDCSSSLCSCHAFPFYCDLSHNSLLLRHVTLFPCTATVSCSACTHSQKGVMVHVL